MLAARSEPKLKMCIAAAVFIAVFVFCVFGFIGCGDAISADGGPAPDGIILRGVDVEYDGRMHSVVVENVAAGDEVLFATAAGGEYFSERPQYINPGEYVIYCKVYRSGVEIFSGDARVTIRSVVLTGISAEPVVAFYDGADHGITVAGVEAGDVIEYSLDGESFSLVAPTFADVGEYRVFYRVERFYGEYRASAAVTVLPDLSGVYVGLRSGAVTLDGFTAVVDGEEFAVSYGVDGHGAVGDIEFSVDGKALSLGGATYEKIDGNENIYVLSVANESFYFHATQAPTAEIVIDGNAAVVTVDGVELTTVADVNYCENADAENYAARSFMKTLTAGSTALVLSRRPTRTLPDKEIFHIYDGLPVDFNIEYDSVVYRTAIGFAEEQPQLYEVGEYDIEAVVLSDKYLPTPWRIGVTIAPNIDGVYYSDTDAVEIDGRAVRLNGEQLRAEYDKTWLIAGQAVTPTDDGITIGGERFVRNACGFVVVVEIADGRYVFQTLATDVTVEWTDASTIIVIDEARSLTVAKADKAVFVNGETFTVIHSAEASFCVIGFGDLDCAVVFIRIGA